MLFFLLHEAAQRSHLLVEFEASHFQLVSDPIKSLSGASQNSFPLG